MSREGGVDILAALRRYMYAQSRARLWLFGLGLLWLVVSMPIDIMRHQYMWTGRASVEEEERDAYRGLVGHCECFQRDESGHLPRCVRAYSTVWTLTTVLQLLLLLVLLHPEGGVVLHWLSGGYVVTVLILFGLFIDCGALTEDDCYLMYLLLPLLLYALLLLLLLPRSGRRSGCFPFS